MQLKVRATRYLYRVRCSLQGYKNGYPGQGREPGTHRVWERGSPNGVRDGDGYLCKINKRCLYRSQRVTVLITQCFD